MNDISYLAALRGVHARDFEREGIPMVLSLQSLIGSVPGATQPAVRADGRRFADALQAARSEIFPSQRDADLGCLITTLQAASSVAFDAAGPGCGPCDANSAPAGPAELPVPGYRDHLDAYRGGRHVRVVNYHNTPHSAAMSLRAELSGLLDRFRVITLEELDAFYASGTWADDRPGFIPVFFEGYRNNAEVAGPVCDELGISAWFLICTGFVDCPDAEQEAFALSHNIELVAEDIGRGALAMTWQQVKDLSKRHTVTPHTSAHEGIAEVMTDADLQREVVEPKRRMDSITGQDAPAMAWLWGSPAGGSPRHDDAIRRAGYRYVVSNTMIQRVR